MGWLWLIGFRIRRAWNKRRRDIDLRILWPVCVEQAPDLDAARFCFYVHAMMDPAWKELGEDVIMAFCEQLEPPP